MTESAQKQQSSGHRIFATSFASIYPHYVAKAVRKGHTAAEVDEVIAWLTGYDEAGLASVLANEVDLQTFFAQAPAWNPNAALIRGTICGYRVHPFEELLPAVERGRHGGLVQPDALQLSFKQRMHGY